MKPRFVLSRLCDGIRKARLTLKRFREERMEVIREYVGNHWSEDGTKKPVPINLIAMYCNVVGRSLIAKNPRVMLSTFDRASKATVAAEQEWVNREVDAMDLATTLKRAVMDGLIGGPGIVKVAYATPSDEALASGSVESGKPFADPIDLDDFVFDVHARDFAEVGFIGHRYRVPLDTVRDSRLYAASRKDLTPAADEFYNAEGDERASVLGRGYYSNEEELEDMVDLWEIYLPRRGLILTLSDENLTGPGQKVLREQDWLGPDCGPYHLLSYATVPGNCMPKSPVQDLIDQHLSVNDMLRKLFRQAARLKQNTFVAGGADEDGGRVLEANDGDIVKVDSPQNILPYVGSGPNQQLFGLFMQMKEIFSWSAGNLDMLGGLSPQSHTATQDELLAKSAGGQVTDMQEVTVTFTARVVKSLLWFWHNNPKLRMHAPYQVPGMDVTVARTVHPHHREKVRLADIDVRVDPYSLRHQTPEGRLQAMQGVVTQVVLPLMQLMQQQGISMDLNAYLSKVGRLMDDPDLAEILTIVEPPETAAPSGGGATMPSNTKRSYERISRPGRTGQGNAMNVASTLMGANPGGAQNGQMNGAMG